MNIKILAINGSPRQGATIQALQIALKELKADGIEWDLLDLHKKKFSLCIDCGSCVAKRSRECVIYDDDITGWAERFPEYEGYLIASPVYDMNITAQLQGFFNRMRSNWVFIEENPRLYARKIGAAIAVGGSRYGGQELVLNAINNYYLSLGVKVVSGASRACNGAAVWSKDSKGTGVLADPEGLISLKAIGQSLAAALKENQVL